MLQANSMIAVVVKVTIPKVRYERLGWGFLDVFIADLTRESHGFLCSPRNCGHNVLVEICIPEMCVNFPDVLIEIRSFVALESGQAQDQVNRIMDMVISQEAFIKDGFGEVRVILEEAKTSARQFRASFSPSFAHPLYAVVGK